MEITTKFKIGDKVWVIYEQDREVRVYIDIVDSIFINKDGVDYWLKYGDGIDFKDNDLILYENKEKAFDKIKELSLEIERKDESENNKVGYQA